MTFVVTIFILREKVEVEFDDFSFKIRKKRPSTLDIAKGKKKYSNI